NCNVHLPAPMSIPNWMELPLRVGVPCKPKALEWRQALPIALVNKPQKGACKWRRRSATRDLKEMMQLTAHQLGALRYGELFCITHSLSVPWRCLGFLSEMLGKK
uniref:Uncharacterized protein n=1 Tax=Chelydra serpentina TaxID=8475 RepID=A0A8C3T4E6_CHESE